MTESRSVGLVKWFNSKVGYGFITQLDEDKKEIFVHYSAIATADSQYKYLVQGEYVEFDLDKSTNDKHEYHAVNISGVRGGPIMCETRRLNKQNGEEDESPEEPVQPRKTSNSRKPRKNTSTEEFVTVDRKNKKRVNSQK